MPVAAMLRIPLGGREVALLGSGAMYLFDSATLLVADAHLGKARSFRRLGVPVPQGTTAQTLAALTTAVAQTGARQVVFLGDLLHSRHAQDRSICDAFMRWRSAHPGLDLTLVRGNHDQHAGDPPPAWGVRLVDEPWPLEGFALCHHPDLTDPPAGAYVLAGHWHPCISLGDRAGQRLRLPCFWLGDETSHPVGVLPAFGAFTGMHPIARRPADRVYAVADGQVRAIPERPGRLALRVATGATSTTSVGPA